MAEQAELPQQKRTAQLHLFLHKERKPFMKAIDETVLDGYNAGIEFGRLRSGIGRIEFAYTKELLLGSLPPPPAVIYDVGGGYGEYAWWLASLGYEVHLFDLSETNIDMSNRLKTEYPGCRLSSAKVCDARSVPRPDGSADALLLMGPLYHITEKEERIAALKESLRLLKSGGLLYAAALTPYSVLLHCTTLYRVEGQSKSRCLEDPAFLEMVRRELSDGCHINPEKSVFDGIGTSHFHTARELREELSAGGFASPEVHGVMGGAWLVRDIETLWHDEVAREALLETVRMVDGHEELMGLSGHLLAICNKP